MTMILAHQGRGLSKDITILDANSDPITPDDDDIVRVTIGWQGEASQLTITSEAPTANGSSITKGAAQRLRIDGADLNFNPGIYSMNVELFDYSDDGEWKTISRQVFALEKT
jgi:hypothetical protein